ncbi:glycosyltransferase family 2 protein [Candidatus Woesearchaeota archaeon]|nr:glycosyltransferase family 2 protein [Candidatus Woesearchaeota archaeon]
MKPLISVIIPTYNEEQHIRRCLNSLLKQDLKEPYDIIVADGMSTDRTRDIVKEYQAKHGNVVLLDNKEKHQAQGRNLAIRKSRAGFVAYIDGHSYASKSWLRTLYDTYKRLSAEDPHVGGVGSIHKDAGRTRMSKATTAAMNSVLGGGLGSSYSEKKDLKRVDTAYACLFPKKVFEELGWYDKRFLKGQDLEFNLRVSKAYNLYLQPKAVTYYYKRDSSKKLWNQMYRYGFWRWKVMKHARRWQPFALAPAAAVIGWLGLGAGTVATGEGWLLAPLAAHLAALLGGSGVVSAAKKTNPWYVLITYLCIHFGYGTGTVAGWVKRTDKTRDRA